MSKPRLFHNRPDQYEGPGDGSDKDDEEREGKGKVGEGGEGKETATHDTPPPQGRQPTEGGASGKRGGGGIRARRDGRGAEGGGIGRRKRPRDPTGTPGRGQSRGEGRHPSRGKCGSPRNHPRMCVPVVAGSLWRLPAPQRRVATGRGNSIHRCMAALLAPACCTISELVRHALWSGGAPLHGNFGGGMARGS